MRPASSSAAARCTLAHGWWRCRGLTSYTSSTITASPAWSCVHSLSKHFLAGKAQKSKVMISACHTAHPDSGSQQRFPGLNPSPCPTRSPCIGADGSLGMNMAGVGGMPNMPTSSGRPNGFSASEHSDHVHKQQRWLLFLRHCAKCNRPDNQCQYGQSCMVAKQLWRHILTCSDPACSYPRYAFRPAPRAAMLRGTRLDRGFQAAGPHNEGSCWPPSDLMAGPCGGI